MDKEKNPMLKNLENRKIKEIEHSRKRREVLQGFERLADTHVAEQVGNLEELVKDMVRNLDLPHACESTKTKSKDKTMTAMEESLVEQGLSLEEAREWLSRN